LMGLVAASVFAVVAITYDSNSAAAVYRDKHARLNALPSPKIVLIGGSNLTYGLDSDQLERDLKLPVINMGYSAGFGLRFMLDDSLTGIKKGDIAVVFPAYEQFQSTLLEGTGDILNILFYHPSSITAIKTWKQVHKIAEYIPTFLQTNLKRKVISPIVHGILRRPENAGLIYTRMDFNEQGDLLGYRKHPASKNIVTKPLSKEALNPETIRALNTFHDQATERGARVILLFPAYGQTAFEQGSSTIAVIENAIRTQTKIDTPDKPEDFVFSDEYLFDNAYHLYATGTTQRTERITNFLRAFLSASSTASLPNKNP